MKHTISSPKEYNFYNDAGHVEIELTKENIENIKKFIDEHIGDFGEYLRDQYTSYDGFMSSYSNNLLDWIITESLLSHPHKLGSVLNFICQVEGIDQETLYYDMEAYLQIINYNEVYEQHFCDECKEFYTEDICPICDK